MAYITYIGRQVKEIACKGCRAMIAARGGPAKNLRLLLLPNYSVMTLKMRNPDGQFSKHQTPMCRDCYNALAVRSTNGEVQPFTDDLMRLYAEDMEQHYKTTVNAGYPVDEVKRMVARFADRIPVAVE